MSAIHPLAFNGAGAMPMGRWTVTEDEAKAYTVTPDDVLRQELWAEWTQVTEGLRAAVGHLPFCWLGGSFFTSKDEPGDIDCVYFIEPVHLFAAKMDPQAARLVQLASGGKQIKQFLGLRVDSFIVPWTPTSALDPRDEGAGEYFQRRGFWDDLWCRHRDDDHRLNRIPRRGYLEVILDGIQ